MSKPRPQDAWAEAWAERYPETQEPKLTRRERLARRYGRGPWLLASAIAFGVLLAPAFAIAQGGGSQTFSSSSRYTLLVRNSGSGNGGATAQTCNTTPGQQACENNVNFGTNYAATYRTTGPTGVYIQTSGSGQATPIQLSPNATGMVQYLNANMVGGLTSEQIFANYQRQSSTSTSSTQGVGQPTSESVTCPSGYNLISAQGAVNQSGGANQGQAVLQGVVPSGNNKATVNAVTIGPETSSTATYTLTAWAVCATV